jgi:hypothetical protein
MKKSTRLMLVVSLASIFAGVSLSAMAQQPTTIQQPPKKPVQKVAPVQTKRPGMPGNPPGASRQMNQNTLQKTNQGGLQQTNHNALHRTNHGGSAQGVKSVGPVTQRHAVVGARGYTFGTRGVRRDIHTFNERERVAWQRGGWHHERRFGRDGWWWEVNGVWYWYAQPMEGPPVYVSEVEYADEPYVDEAPDVGGYPPPPAIVGGYPPPPPPPSEAIGGAIGGAILGGVLVGAITGRAGGAAAGALIGGATGAAIGAEAERRHGYYWWQGTCYYRYPSGNYAPVAPGYCS